MAVKAKWQNREQVMKRLRQLVPDAEKEAAKAQLEAAQELATAVRARAPKLTGEYVSTIQAGRLADAPEGQSLIGINATKDPNATGLFARFYWRFIEFGTSQRTQKKTGRNVGSMPAHPHIFPTFRAYRKRIRRKVATAVNKAVRKAKGK